MELDVALVSRSGRVKREQEERDAEAARALQQQLNEAKASEQVRLVCARAEARA
jgi:hypothetical protein